MKTRTVLLKINNALGTVTLAHPGALPGRRAGDEHCVATKEIRDVPIDVPTSLVVRAFAATTDATWMDGAEERFSFAWREIGEGRTLLPASLAGKGGAS